MKKLTLFLLITFNYNAYNQTVVPLCEFPNYLTQNNVYFKDINNHLSKFEGLWEFNDGTHHLIVRFYKVNQFLIGGGSLSLTQYSDEIHSFIEYKKFENSIWITKYNTFPYPEAINGLCNKCIKGTLQTTNQYKLSMHYSEPSASCTRLKSAYLNLTYVLDINSLVPQLIWERIMNSENRYGMDIPCPDGQMIDITDFKLPSNMILTKID
jgi:hypothetical protein